MTATHGSRPPSTWWGTSATAAGDTTRAGYEIVGISVEIMWHAPALLHVGAGLVVQADVT